MHAVSCECCAAGKSRDLQAARHAMAETAPHASTYTRVSCECFAGGESRDLGSVRHAMVKAVPHAYFIFRIFSTSESPPSSHPSCVTLICRLQPLQ
jgi:hypothetical protein